MKNSSFYSFKNRNIVNNCNKKIRGENMLFPNLPTKTGGGQVFWNTIKTRNGWKIQQNIFTQHYRVLDPNNVRHGWSSELHEIDQLFETYTGERFR